MTRPCVTPKSPSRRTEMSAAVRRLKATARAIAHVSPSLAADVRAAIDVVIEVEGVLRRAATRSGTISGNEERCLQRAVERLACVSQKPKE